MELKKLKEEVDGLTRFNKTLSNFNNSWVKQIKQNTNQHFPFLQKLDSGIKKEINSHVFNSQKVIKELAKSHFTQEKISSLAHYLVELKLAHFRGNPKKSKILINKFVKDDFLNLKKVVNEVCDTDFNIKNLKKTYEQANKIIIKNLPLEESVTFMDAEHQKHFNHLSETSKKQKKLLKVLGGEFVSLVREMKKKS